LSKSCWLIRSRKVSVDMMHICGFRESRSSCKDESHEKCRVNEDKSPGLLLVWESRVGNFRVDLQTAAERFVLISFHGLIRRCSFASRDWHPINAVSLDHCFKFPAN